MVVHRAGQLMPIWMKLKEEGGEEDAGMIKHVRTFSQVRYSDCFKN